MNTSFKISLTFSCALVDEHYGVLSMFNHALIWQYIVAIQEQHMKKIFSQNYVDYCGLLDIWWSNEGHSSKIKPRFDNIPQCVKVVVKVQKVLDFEDVKTKFNQDKYLSKSLDLHGSLLVMVMKFVS